VRAHIARDLISGRVDVYLFEATPRGKNFYALDAVDGEGIGTFTVRSVGEMERVERPSFSLPIQIWDAIMADARGHADADATKDARATRDRLLALVEKLAAPPPPISVLSTEPAGTFEPRSRGSR
jgi:hypothetical protein